MRIGVDATCWNNNRGYGRHARALLGALIERDESNTYTLFFDTRSLTNPPPPGCTVEYVTSAASASDAASSSGRRSMGDMRAVSRALAAGRFDVLIFPTVYTYVPVFTPARKIVFLHDVIAETFPKLTLPRWSARQFWRAKVSAARFQADALVTVSDYSKRRLVEHFSTSPNKVWVVGEAPDKAFRLLHECVLTPSLIRAGISPEAQKVVYLGGFSPHKNLPALLRAFARLEAANELQLVLVGEYKKEVFHSGYGEIRQLIDELGIGERVVFTGYLSDEDVAALLNLSDVLVLPSLMEGYGLPAVEAAACGCPVIATNESPLAGLLGEGIISIAPVQSEIESALRRVLRSPELRQKMHEAGLKAVQKLTWDTAAEEMLAVIGSFRTPSHNKHTETSLADR